MRRARLYITALGVYEAQINGVDRGRPRHGARLDQLRPPAALPDVRRDARCCSRRPQCHWARCWATAGTAAGWASAAAGATSTATGWRCWPSSRSSTPTARPSASSPTRRWRAADGADPGERHLRRRDLRRPPRAAGLVARRLRRRRLGGRAPRWSGTWRRWSRRPARRCAAPRCVAPVAITTSPSGPHHRRLRPEPGRPAAADACRARPGRRSRCATPRCSRTASCARGRCAIAAATDRYTLRGERRGDVGAALHLPRLPLCRGRRLAGRAARRMRSRRSSATPTWSAPAGSSARTRWSTGCTRTSSGACAATSSTSPPTARSATSAWAGPATSRSSRPPACFLYDVGGLPAVVAGRPGRRADGRGRHRALRRAQRDGCRRSRRRPPGAMRPWSCPGCCTSATATPASWPTSSTSMRAWVDLVASAAGPSRLWERGLPVRRLARPRGAAGQARATRAPPPFVVATAYFARSAELLAQAAERARPRRGRSARTWRWPPRSATPSRASTSRRPAG